LDWLIVLIDFSDTTYEASADLPHGSHRDGCDFVHAFSRLSIFTRRIVVGVTSTQVNR
jgi:hypothetical protein